jgi:hypothetical protein
MFTFHEYFHEHTIMHYRAEISGNSLIFNKKPYQLIFNLFHGETGIFRLYVNIR